MRTIWTSNPRSPSTNDGPRALVLSYGFQKQAIAILKRLTLVTLFLHVRRAVRLKEGRSAPRTPSRLAPLTAKRLSEIQYSTFRKILCYCERRASPQHVYATLASAIETTLLCNNVTTEKPKPARLHHSLRYATSSRNCAAYLSVKFCA